MGTAGCSCCGSTVPTPSGWWRAGRGRNRVDAQGVRDASVLLARLDGLSIDNGTVCEIGMFAELAATGATAASSVS
jgi:hypothetical protein